MRLDFPIEMRTVYRPGSWVKIGDDVPATIHQVSIVEDGVSYQVVWWDGRTRKCEWLAPHEIRGEVESEMKIGFLQ